MIPALRHSIRTIMVLVHVMTAIMMTILRMIGDGCLPSGERQMMDERYVNGDSGDDGDGAGDGNDHDDEK